MLSFLKYLLRLFAECALWLSFVDLIYYPEQDPIQFCWYLNWSESLLFFECCLFFSASLRLAWDAISSSWPFSFSVCNFVSAFPTVLFFNEPFFRFWYAKTSACFVLFSKWADVVLGGILLGSTTTIWAFPRQGFRFWICKSFLKDLFRCIYE